ncbi:MAG: STAS domain-containing protein [Methanocorpusculum sp.]|nr:STAS domain-containing protein [Methanocorpusculum sp.]
MKLIIKKKGKELIAEPEDKIDSTNAVDIRKAIEGELEGVSIVTFDFNKLDYISSMGIVVILAIRKKLGNYGKIRIVNASGIVREVFEMSGFDELLVN